MYGVDKDALTCDFAETYHIFDIRALPLNVVAVLAVGLRDNSRIKMKVAGINGTPEEILLAHAVDNLRYLVYSKTIDAEAGKNKPVPIAPNFFDEKIKTDKKDKAHHSFSDSKEFERIRKQLERR